MKKLLPLLLITAHALAGNIVGTLQGPSGLPVKNATLTFTLQQAGLAIGTGNIAALSSQCFTSSDGMVVGLPNPLALPVVAVNYGTGTLPAGIYYVQIAYYTAAGMATLPSPETVVQLTSAGSFTIAAPVAGVPPGAAGFIGYVGAVSGGEASQGQTSGTTAGLTVQAPLQGIPPGVAPVGANNTVCGVAFNDTIIPYTGYNVSLVSSGGNAYPGWPQAWQLNGGINGTVNVSSGAPLWNGVTVFPQPIVQQPLNHGPQSIAGLLNMTGYNLVNAAAVGIGTTTPGFPLDVENGYINTNLGYLVAGAGGSTGQCLVSNGTFFGPGSCGTLPAIYYQHLQRNGSLFSQEPFLNFSTDFAVNDNPGSTRTDVALYATGVTAGSYTSANLTVDANGRVLAASNGGSSTLPSKITPLIINSGICTTSGSSYGTCTFTATWPTAFADTNYVITCFASAPILVSGTHAVANLSWYGRTTTGFTLQLQNGTSDGASQSTVDEIDCTGTHP